MTTLSKIYTYGDGISYPTNGSKVLLHYIVYLDQNTKIESSRDRGEMEEFTIGMGLIVPSFEIALMQMSVGERALFKLDAQSTYGIKGLEGFIKPNTDIYADIELLSVQ